MDRVDLAQLHGKQRLRAWIQGGPQSSFSTAVSFGWLSDGRWFAERVGYASDADDRQLGACVFSADDRGETLALRMAYRWMTEGEWRAQPAAFGADGLPADALPWVRRGGEWFLEG